jgi:hypothetical protein
MTTKTRKACLVAGLAGIMSLGVMIAPALSHHSFAMYDQQQTKTYTGRLTRFIPGGNHSQLIFEVLDADGKQVMQNGKPLLWGVETASAAAMSRRGVTVETFPLGTILTVTLHPLRDGRPLGAMTSLIKCGTTMPKGGCTKETGQVMAGTEAT